MAHALRPLTSGASAVSRRATLGAWIVFWALAFGAPAQTPRAAEQAGRFTVFSARPVADLGFAPRAGAPRQPVVFYPTARSPRYDYRSAMPLRFSDGPTGAVVTSVNIPPDIREALLLFSPIVPAPATGLRYQVVVLDDSALRHGAGALVVINLSGLALSGTVGNHEVTLTAGLNPPLAAASSAKIVLRTSAGGRPYQAYAGALQLKKNERALLILFPPFYKGSHEVQSRLLVDDPSAPQTAVPGKK